MHVQGSDWRWIARLVVLPAWRLLARGRPGRAVAVAMRRGDALLRDGLWPSEMAAFAEHRPELRLRRRELYLQLDHRRHLRSYRDAIAQEGLSDKAVFAAFCRRGALPHPATITLDAARSTERLAEVDALPGERRFIKPATGSNANGAALLHRIGPGDWELDDAKAARRGSLKSLLISHLPGQTLVVQSHLANAPALAAWVGKALATFRIVTARSHDGRVEAVSMLAELPLDDRLPIPKHWAIFPVQPSDNRLPPIGRPLRDPVLEARAGAYAGKTIEAADAMRALACEAHRQLIGEAQRVLPPMIGWDAAWTAEGVVLLECNWNWAVAPHYINTAGIDFGLSDTFRAIAATAIEVSPLAEWQPLVS